MWDRWSSHEEALLCCVTQVDGRTDEQSHHHHFWYVCFYILLKYCEFLVMFEQYSSSLLLLGGGDVFLTLPAITMDGDDIGWGAPHVAWHIRTPRLASTSTVGVQNQRPLKAKDESPLSYTIAQHLGGLYFFFFFPCCEAAPFPKFCFSFIFGSWPQLCNDYIGIIALCVHSTVQ